MFVAETRKGTGCSKGRETEQRVGVMFLEGKRIGCGVVCESAVWVSAVKND